MAQPLLELKNLWHHALDMALPPFEDAVDVVDSMKDIAPLRGFSGYQALMKAYISDGLRRDEAQYVFSAEARLIEALKKRGVPIEILEAAAKELHA